MIETVAPLVAIGILSVSKPHRRLVLRVSLVSVILGATLSLLLFLQNKGTKSAKKRMGVRLCSLFHPRTSPSKTPARGAPIRERGGLSVGFGVPFGPAWRRIF
jgi:hypothetical protein